LPLLWLSLAFLLGVVLAAWQSLAGWVWISLAGVALVFGIIKKRLGWGARFWVLSPLSWGFVLAALFAGAARYTLAQPEWTPHDLAWYNDRGSAQMVGVIGTPPERTSKDKVRAQVSIQQITLLTQENPSRKTQLIHGKLLAILPANQDWRYGDRIELVGQPQVPPENPDFSYRDYLAQQGIFTYLPYNRAELLEHNDGNPFLSIIFALRQRAYRFVLQSVPQPEGALLAGILLGIEDDIPEQVNQAFQQTGTAHIIAISGFNIAIVAGLFSLLFSKLFSSIIPRLWMPLLVIAAIAFYTILVGAQPSVVRAAIMGGFGLIGEQIGRRGSGVNSLAFCAALMVFANPLILWNVAFQLSFMATLGLVLFADPLQQGFIRLASRRLSAATVAKLAGPVGEYFLITLAAQVTTLPVVIYHFQRVSISAVIANPLALPPQPLVMVLGGIAVLVGLVIPVLGKALALLTWPVLAYTIRAVELLAGIQGSSFSLGKESLWWVALFYLVLVQFTFGRRMLSGLREKLKVSTLWSWIISPVALLTLALVVGLTWRIVLTRPDGRLHLTLFQQEKGLSALIQTPGGRWLVLNGMDRSNTLANALGRRLPPFEHNIDFWIVTLIKKDQLESLSALVGRYPPGQVLLRQVKTSPASLVNLQQKLLQAQVPVEALSAGQVLDLGNGAVLRVQDTGEKTALLTLEWLYFQAQLVETGDGLSVSTPAGALPELKQEEWLELVTDGKQVWVKVERK